MFLGDWRVHPKQNRFASECKVDKMTDEDWKKYGSVNPEKYKGLGLIGPNPKKGVRK